MKGAQLISRLFVCFALACLGGTAAYNVKNCQQALCDFEVPPECQQWRNVHCDFRGDRDKRIKITATSFPSNAREIIISNVKEVKLHSNAVKGLELLREIRFENVEKLVMFSNSMAQGAKLGGVTVSLNSVQYLQLHPNTFSGWQAKESEINIKNVNKCDVTGSTFPAGTSITSVRLENIASLRAETGAFAANIKELNLEAVTMDSCDHNTFGGQIKSLTLSQVSADVIREGCIRANEGWDLLRLRLCSFTRVEPGGILGMIKKVVIENSKMSYVCTDGLSLRCSSFAMYQNEIGTLADNALNIASENSVTVEGLAIQLLSSRGFDQTKVREKGLSANFTNIYINQAEEESLVFAQADRVTIQYVVLNQPCTCDALKYKSLVVREAGNPSYARNDLDDSLVDIFSNILCKSDDGQSTPIAEYHHEHCPNSSILTRTAHTSSGDSSYSHSDPSSGRDRVIGESPGHRSTVKGMSWWMYLIILTLFLIVFIGLIICGVLINQRLHLILQIGTWIRAQMGERNNPSGDPDSLKPLNAAENSTTSSHSSIGISRDSADNSFSLPRSPASPETDRGPGNSDSSPGENPRYDSFTSNRRLSTPETDSSGSDQTPVQSASTRITDQQTSGLRRRN